MPAAGPPSRIHLESDEPPAGAGPGQPEQQRFMRRRKRKAMHLKINVTPLIDVTILLLVYFMIATSFTASEEVYRTDIPNREGIGSGDPFQLEDDPLRISVFSTGLGSEMYRLQIDGPYPQPATFDDLHAFLTARQVGPNTTGGLFESDHPILIQPARSALWDHAIEAFNAAARARYTNVTFAKPI